MKEMTDEQRIKFIRKKIAPLFDGMNAQDVLAILEDTILLREAVFSQLTVSLNRQKT
jgi:hypothetical protein